MDNYQFRLEKSAYEYRWKIVLSILLFSLIIGIPMLIYWIARARKEEWLFIDEKYTHSYGVFEKHSEEKTLSKVLSVRINQKLFQRIFNVGDINVSLVGGLGFYATNIKKPNEAKAYFEQLVSNGSDIQQALVN